jgi:hypothetical protein
MKAPVGFTCNDISACIQWLKHAKSQIESVIDEITQGDEVHYKDKVLNSLDEALKYIDIFSELEDLRSANSALREWGYKLTRELEDLKREL